MLCLLVKSYSKEKHHVPKVGPGVQLLTTACSHWEHRKNTVISVSSDWKAIFKCLVNFEFRKLVMLFKYFPLTSAISFSIGFPALAWCPPHMYSTWHFSWFQSRKLGTVICWILIYFVFPSIMIRSTVSQLMLWCNQSNKNIQSVTLQSSRLNVKNSQWAESSLTVLTSNDFIVLI